MARTFIVGYDGSVGAERAVARAAELAPALSARVVVLEVQPLPVVETSMAGAWGLATYPSLAEELEEAERRALEEHRERVAAFFDDRGVAHEFVTARGSPAEELLEAAKRESADLIIVGPRDAGFFERLLTGSVSGRVAREADCDVLMVRGAA